MGEKKLIPHVDFGAGGRWDWSEEDPVNGLFYSQVSRFVCLVLGVGVGEEPLQCTGGESDISRTICI